MNYKEIGLWTGVYWLMYLSLAGLVTVVTGRGGVVELVLMGVLMTMVLVLVLQPREGLFFERPVVTVPPRRGRKPKQMVEVKHEEVVEPEPEMRSDVALVELDVDELRG